MKSNGLLKWLMIPVLALAVYVGIRMFSTPEGQPASSPDKHESQLTNEEAKKLGIDGDTARDTVATLVAQVKQLRQELNAAMHNNKAQKAQNYRSEALDNVIDQRVQSAVNAERDKWREDQEKANAADRQAHGVVEELQRRLDDMSMKSGHADLPVGLGLQDGDSVGVDDSVRWHEPLDTRPSDAKRSQSRSKSLTPLSDERFATSFGAASETSSDSIDDSRKEASANSVTMKLSSVEPVYTVPANATLMGSIAMTALIGRIPIDGTVNDPYPFKVVVGPDNLAANGIDLPDIAGAILGGTASGDWTLSCVRGQIRSLTFVFADGTIRTASSSASRGGDAANSLEHGLGWISDPYGIPCVSGKQVSNARQYLGSQMLITAAGAGAASLIDSGSGNFSFANGSNGSIGSVGISGNEAMGRILGGGVQELSQWVNKLYGQAFAAVYVRPGAKVAVHIEQPLEIDYDTTGRKVAHRLGDVHAPDLD